MPTTSLIIGGILALHVGVFALLLRRRRRLVAQVANSRLWPSAASSVISARMQVKTGARSGREYLPVVEYTYRVDARTFRSSRLYFGETVVYNLERRAQKRLAALATSAAVQVFYDPRDPAQAVIERSAPVLRRDLVLMALLVAGLVGLAVAALDVQ